MGAGTTEVRDNTTDVLLEAAVWDPAAVSRTQRRLHLVSEAGRRYERTVDPAVSVAALDRCATLLAEIAGGTVEPTLTDWRGDPPRDDWSPPPVSMAVDLPDRTAGVDYADGTTRAAADADRRRRWPTDGDRVTVTPPSWRPDLRAARRPRRGGAAAGGPRDHPVGAAARRRPGAVSRRCRSAAARSESRWRSTAMSRSCRRRSCRPACSTSGVCPPTIRVATTTRCSTRWSPTARSWPPRCCPGCWKPWRATCPAARSTSRCYAIEQVVRADTGNPRRRTHSERPPAHRRRDRRARRVAARASRSTSGWCWPACANPRARGVRAGRWMPPTRSRRCASSAARAGVELTLRPAQHLPWHPGRCAEVLRRRRGRRVRRPAAPRGHRALRAAEGHLRGRAGPRRDPDHRDAARAVRCRRSRRCSRTSP